ncbi:MerR family transcriptional regulator [Rhodococcoides kyotonense]|uniref:DNA-binding transcriptional regulator, MerR family n=1 Tax=Rhodococcoides kyotonense TaxID=398843 RepID=A0A239M7D6_9NOCA|nr:MerR family transcriptional regulator [Rhodococcus kyotonensis]SNT38360.1 DNA-binding transcriptional regulator, MerR family [Rhodococcus kyotonensis]
MRVSQLVAASGVPLATIKYYLREGLLMPGISTSATQSTYGDEHVERLALIKALAGAGLPIDRIRTVLRLIEYPEASLFQTLGRAIAELPPYLDDADAEDYPLAKAALEKLGQVYDPRFVAVAQLDRALRAAEEVGIPMTDERLEVYGRHVRGIADYDLSLMPDTVEAAVEYSVIGTAVYEPVITALRRLAHQDIASALERPAT